MTDIWLDSKQSQKIGTKTNPSDIKERKVSPDTLTEAVHVVFLELDNTMDVKMLSETLCMNYITQVVFKKKCAFLPFKKKI